VPPKRVYKKPAYVKPAYKSAYVKPVYKKPVYRPVYKPKSYYTPAKKPSYTKKAYKPKKSKKSKKKYKYNDTYRIKIKLTTTSWFTSIFTSSSSSSRGYGGYSKEVCSPSTYNVENGQYTPGGSYNYNYKRYVAGYCSP